jgi:hypothetical protein
VGAARERKARPVCAAESARNAASRTAAGQDLGQSGVLSAVARERRYLAQPSLDELDGLPLESGARSRLGHTRMLRRE